MQTNMSISISSHQTYWSQESLIDGIYIPQSSLESLIDRKFIHKDANPQIHMVLSVHSVHFFVRSKM